MVGRALDGEIQRHVQPMLAGGGDQPREVLEIAQFRVQGVVAALDRCAGYEIYNLGESETTSLSELVDQIGAVCGRAPVLDRQPLQPGDVLITFADVSKARAKLGYQPTTPIAEGLRRYVAWYRSQPEAAAAALR